MDQDRGLVGNRLHQFGVGMAQPVHRHAGDRIEIALAGFVPQIGAFAAHKGDGLAGIGIHQVFGHGSKVYSAKTKLFTKAIRRPKPPYPFRDSTTLAFFGLSQAVHTRAHEVSTAWRSTA